LYDQPLVPKINLVTPIPPQPYGALSTSNRHASPYILGGCELTELFIGAGGWAYFQVPGLRPIEAYARAFDFVEVNSTFYQLPTLSLVRSWRRRVPPHFEFSVRCHRALTHRYSFQPLPETFRLFETMRAICRILRSSFLVCVTPPSLTYSRAQVHSMREFFGSLDLTGIRLVWEVRRRGGEPIPPDLLSLMEDFDVIHCVDLSRDVPAVDSSTVYTRVFGKGEHNVYQFADEELLDLDRRLTDDTVDTAVVSFHNTKMYKDAARYKVYKQTHAFPNVTGATGQRSLRTILLEDADFPTSKRALIRDQGWKVIDLTEDRRIHASAILDQLPDLTFRDLEDVLANLPPSLS
jgi:uncharacterized protein YecE (DUF72 family)